MAGRAPGGVPALPAGLRYLLRRLGQLVPTVLTVSLIAFVLIRLSGDPTALLLTPEATEAERRAFGMLMGSTGPCPFSTSSSSAISCAAISAPRSGSTSPRYASS
jgi:hypothetical protein